MNVFSKLVIILLGVFFLLSAQDVRTIAVGSLHNWYRADGCEPEIGRTRVVSDQQDGLRWPAQFKWQDTQAAKGLWIGTANYTDAGQYGGDSFEYKVVHVGPRSSNPDYEFMPIGFKLIARQASPVVRVDGLDASQIALDEQVDEINPELYCDRQIVNIVNTSIGITVKRTISAWAQQNHDNYFIYDYWFINTGNVDSDEEIEQQVTLDSVYFFFQYRYAPTREACAYGYYWLPQSATWGASTMLDARGEDPLAGDPFRAQFAWLGKHSQWKGPGDNIGAPDYFGDGRLGAAQYMGVVTLHADKSAQDHSDDSAQPATTQYVDSDALINVNNDQFNGTQMAQEYAAMCAGHPAVRFADAVGDGYADQFGGSGAGYSHGQGFGPYTLAPGDSIHIVLAEAVAGLDREKIYNIGKKWKENKAPFLMPDGSSGNDRNEYKNAWVYTGQDSLFLTFERAKENYESDFTIPVAPDPPDTFTVETAQDHIVLTWSANAENTPSFGGYALYRALNRNDTVFTPVFSCGLNTEHPQIVHRYEDYDIARGRKYYYYIISFDDGSANNGVPLKSSLFLTRTSEAAVVTGMEQASPLRPEQCALMQNFPNPFNPSTRIRYRVANTGYVTLAVYNMLGQKVKELVNGKQPAGEYQLLFKAGDLAAGVYVYRLTIDGRFSQSKKMILIR